VKRIFQSFGETFHSERTAQTLKGISRLIELFYLREFAASHLQIVLNLRCGDLQIATLYGVSMDCLSHSKQQSSAWKYDSMICNNKQICAIWDIMMSQR
jgi:hypothetical protein